MILKNRKHNQNELVSFLKSWSLLNSNRSIIFMAKTNQMLVVDEFQIVQIQTDERTIVVVLFRFIAKIISTEFHNNSLLCNIFHPPSICLHVAFDHIVKSF